MRKGKSVIAISLLLATAASLLCSCTLGGTGDVTVAPNTDNSVTENNGSDASETAEVIETDSATETDSGTEVSDITSSHSGDTTSEIPDDTTSQPPEDITSGTPEQTTGPETTTAPEQTTGAPEVTTEPPHVHSFSSVWSKNNAQHWHECNCGEKADVSAHSYGDWIVTKAATETAQGSKKHTCTVCGFEEIQIIPTLDHVHTFSDNWSENVAQHWHECSCGEKTDVAVHSFGNWTITEDATCTAVGSKKRACTVCGYEETASIEKVVHAPVTDPAVPANCTETGKTEGSHCSVCGAVLTAQQTVAAPGHSFGEWAITKDATCIEKGCEQRKCSFCLTTESRDIDALGHDYIATVVPPTATVDGYTEHKCSRCNDSFRDNIVEATGSIGLAYQDNGDGSCTITGIGTCSDVDIIVPTRIDNLTVVAIGDKAFENQTGITSIHLPDSITKIGRRAYYGCTNLHETNIPKNVTTIGTQLFFKSGIESVTYSSSYPSDPTDDQANDIFAGSTTLKSITFNGYWVPRKICRGCTSLTNVIITDDVKYILRGALSGCTNLTSITIPDSVTSITYEVFSGCTSLASITIPDSLVAIESQAFYGCSSLASITIPDSVTIIESQAFYGCSSLTSISIPHNVRSIGEESFFDCTKLAEITISTGVTSIGKAAFGNCKNLTNITIPNSVTSIGGSAFYNCVSLKSIIVPDSVTRIEDWTFKDCTGLASITIPDSVTRIGIGAFSNCTNLTNITIPDSITSIEIQSFIGCTSLTNITIPDSVTSIGDSAFIDCSSLVNITLPNSVTSIEKYTFWNCSNLASITIPDSVRSIGEYAFIGCSCLININYTGTMTQWNSIKKDNPYFNEGLSVHCLDGDCPAND